MPWHAVGSDSEGSFLCSACNVQSQGGVHNVKVDTSGEGRTTISLVDDSINLIVTLYVIIYNRQTSSILLNIIPLL